MAKPDNPGAYSPGDIRRNESLQALDDIGPENCYCCGASWGTPHSPECNIHRRGNQAWARDAAAITAGGTPGEGDASIEHRMVSRPGQRGWRKAPP